MRDNDDNMALLPNDPETDADKNSLVMGAYNAIDDPTRFATRSFVVIWNEGHSIRLINRDDPRKAISIPWDEVEALRAVLVGTQPNGGQCAYPGCDLPRYSHSHPEHKG